MTSAPNMLTEALAYGEAGFRVFPVHEPTPDGGCTCHDSECASKGKHPRIGMWRQKATTDAAQIREWWTQWPTANIGLLTGAENGVVVVDVDPRNGGDVSIDRLIEERGDFTEAAPVAQTGGGGAHVHFRHPGVPVKSRSNALAAGLDVKADGGYVVAPPSLHESGLRYEWVADLRKTPPREMPEWLLVRMTTDPQQPADFADADVETTPEGKEQLAFWVSEIDKIPEGHRNDGLFAACCSIGRVVAHGDLAPKEAVDAVTAAVAKWSDQPKTLGTMRNGLQTGYAVCVAALKTARLPQTDLGNAERLLVRHGEDLLYSVPQRKWFVFDGRRWARDERGQVRELAKETVRHIEKEAWAYDRDSERQKKQRSDLFAHGKRSEAAARISAMIELAATDKRVAVVPAQLDADPWAFCVRNGTIDLRTGELRSHDRAELITKISPVSYDPDAQSDVFDGFLGDATSGDADLQDYLQRASGYALTGETSEKCFFMVFGPPDTSKSTFVDSIKAAMGDYAAVASAETWLEQYRAGGNRGDIVRLLGVRAVFTVELPGDRRFDSELIKQITGGDELTFAKKYEDEIQFQPTMKIFQATNTAPAIRNDDVGMWNRARRLPFTNTIPKAKQDKKLRERLRDPEDLGPAVLAWMVRGCLAWQERGLDPPAVVQQSTAEYRHDSDVFARFVADRCVLDPDGRVTRAALRAAYDEFCEGEGIPEKARLGSRRFTARARQVTGVSEGKSGDRRWEGIRLRQADERDDLDGAGPADRFVAAMTLGADK